MTTHDHDHRLNAILGLMLRSECTLEQIAAEHDLTFVTLLEILRSPQAQAAIAAIEELQALRDRLRAPLQRDAALARLNHIATTSENELEARRAATTILRARATDPAPRISAPKQPAAQAPLPLDASMPHASMPSATEQPFSFRFPSIVPSRDAAKPQHSARRNAVVSRNTPTAPSAFARNHIADLLPNTS